MRILTPVALLLLAACQGNVTNIPPTLPSLPETPMTTQMIPFPTPLPTFPSTSHPYPEATSALPSLLPLKPVIDRDFPDPDILKLEDAYFAYATNSSRVNLQVARSSNLMEWELLPDAMPALPSWAVKRFGYIWAPEVTLSPGGGMFILYFTARFARRRGGTQCIGVATSPQPEGPFQPLEQPLICQIEQGGSIDAASFDEDGTRYLLWKNDGNSVGGQSWIYIQQLSEDGLALTGEPTRLITADQPWEGVLVEAPTLWKHAGRYYLFYSANAYTSRRYAVGYAVAENIFGPYQKAAQPMLSTNLKAGVVGPGGQDLVEDAFGDTWMLFHGWAAEGVRKMFITQLAWESGVPVPLSLSGELQPLP